MPNMGWTYVRDLHFGDIVGINDKQFTVLGNAPFDHDKNRVVVTDVSTEEPHDLDLHPGQLLFVY